MRLKVNLSEPSLIRGIMTQGRNGCCHQWVKKYRVLYSLDCGSNASSWHPIGDHTVNDTVSSVLFVRIFHILNVKVLNCMLVMRLQLKLKKPTFLYKINAHILLIFNREYLFLLLANHKIETCIIL